MIRGGIQFLGLAAVAAVIGIAHAQLPVEPRSVESQGYLPDPDVARIASFGFDSLVADFYWFRAVQIAGSPGGTAGESHTIGALVDLVTELDPWVDHPYRFAALWMNDDLEAVEKANRLLERSLVYHPDEWRNRFYLAFNHFFYLGQQKEAALALEPAIALEGAPAYLGRLVARLKSSEGGLEASAAFLQELVRRAPDEYTKAGYLRALDEIETERRARFLDQARAAFQERHGRDIDAVDDLLAGESPVLRELPPEPHGARWVIGEEGQIVSSRLRFRYRPKIDSVNRKAIRKMRDENDSRSAL